MSVAPHFPHDVRALRIALRVAGFFCLWLALAGATVGDLPVGLAAAAIATWISLRLLPPGSSRIRPTAVIHLVMRFLLQSILAGLDITRRALDPRLPLQPGFRLFSLHLAAGPARSMFCMVESLLPGTLPAGFDENGSLVLHCLDTDQPVLTQMTADEALFLDALGLGGRHG